MHRIVRHRVTGKFLAETGTWTDSAQRAAAFPNFLAAVRACLNSGCAEAEVVLRFEPFESEIAIPIG
jgi:hypothetical protein